MVINFYAMISSVVFFLTKCINNKQTIQPTINPQNGKIEKNATIMN